MICNDSLRYQFFKQLFSLILKSYVIFFCKKVYRTLKIKIIQKQNKTFSRNFLYKFIPSGNRFSIILSNRTSDYTRATRGLFIISFIKLKNHRRWFSLVYFLILGKDCISFMEEFNNVCL